MVCTVSVASSQCLGGGLLVFLDFLVQCLRLTNELGLLTKRSLLLHSRNAFCIVFTTHWSRPPRLISCNACTRNAVFSFTVARRASTRRRAAANRISSRLGE